MSSEGLPHTITVDGPSGSGKGTLAYRLARHYGWHLLDSGALYRLTALHARNQQIRLDDEGAVATAARSLPVEFIDGEDGVCPLLGGIDVSRSIRTEEAGRDASKVASLPAVREALLQRQRDFCCFPGLIADGRDMGTVVFPEATAKLFLTASAEERAKRRYNQLIEKGLDANLHTLVRDIKERDERDATRSVAPLRAAPDALMIDSTGVTIDEVVRRAKEWIDMRLQHSSLTASD